MIASPSTRWWRWLQNRRRLACPDGHHISDKFRTSETVAVRCDKRFGRTAECGRWLYVIAIPGGGGIIAEVSLDEIAEMEELADATAILNYLDIFPS